MKNYKHGCSKDIALDSCKLITPRRFLDDRGYFCETWNRRSLLSEGIDVDFVQDNLSLSHEIGTVRGLHCQLPPHAQAKLVRCPRGRLFDVAVDIRKGSPGFGRWIGEELSADNGRQLFIPAGFLHGFITLEPNTEIMYKCSAYYTPECDVSVRFDDPDIAIDWPIATARTVVSDKDDAALQFADFDSPFVYEV